jgi:hypothetical protein
MTNGVVTDDTPAPRPMLALRSRCMVESAASDDRRARSTKCSSAGCDRKVTRKGPES